MRRAALAASSLVSLAVSVLAAACSGRGAEVASAPGATSSPAGRATVERVVDGDTLVVRVQGRRERVRLIGVDTPESVAPDRPVECFGREASARTASLLPRGTGVRLVRDVEARDRHGRLLAYVYREGDGLFVNLALLQDGYATLLTIPPNVAHADRLFQASRDARAGSRGLWAACPARR